MNDALLKECGSFLPTSIISSGLPDNQIHISQSALQHLRRFAFLTEIK